MKLQPEPVQIQGATFIVTKTELLPYLTDDVLKAPTALAQQSIASAYTRARERDKQQPPVALASSPTAQTKPAVPVKTEPVFEPSQPAQSPHMVAVVPLPAQPMNKQQASTAATIAPPVVVRSGAQNAISYDAFNRSICESMPSLGEAAQCFNQLKRAAAGTPQK